MPKELSFPWVKVDQLNKKPLESGQCINLGLRNVRWLAASPYYEDQQHICNTSKLHPLPPPFSSPYSECPTNDNKNSTMPRNHWWYQFVVLVVPIDVNIWTQAVSFFSCSDKAKPLGLSLEKMYAENSSSRSPGILSQIVGLPCEMLSYVSMHTFGRWIIYPGHTELLNQLVGEYHFLHPPSHI